jgi:hypothetical protein
VTQQPDKSFVAGKQAKLMIEVTLIFLATINHCGTPSRKWNTYVQQPTTTGYYMRLALSAHRSSGGEQQK